MTDYTTVEQINERYSANFIHTAFGHFFRDLLDYFGDTLYPRFQTETIGTYDKAVEYLKRKNEIGREQDKPILPALILNPSGSFEPADANAGGRFPWRYPNLAPGMIKRIFDPVYTDGNVMVSVGFMRIKGEIDLIMLMGSFYEYCDLRLLFLQMFNGFDRIIHPQYFSSYVVLPDELVNFRYENKYTGINYKIDWTEAVAENTVVKTTNQNEIVIPFQTSPTIKLQSLDDGSNRYGGTTDLAEWRLNATIGYEIELPTYLVIFSNYLVENITYEIKYGSVYSKYPEYRPPSDRHLYDISYSWGVDETSFGILDLVDSTSILEVIGDFVYKTRYYHIITRSEVLGTGDIIINLPETVTDLRCLLVNSRNGPLDYGDHYRLGRDGRTLTVRRKTVLFKPGMVIEVYIYELM